MTIILPMFCDGLKWFCIPLEDFLRLSEYLIVFPIGLLLLVMGFNLFWSCVEGRPRLFPDEED